MKYDNHRDAAMRLEGTIITYRKRAAVVDHIYEDLTLGLRRLHDGKEFRAKQDSKWVQMRAPQLGYVNLATGARYAMRKPARKWKQGLHPAQIWYGENFNRFRDRVTHVELAQCLDGKYPSLGQALRGFKVTNPFRPVQVDKIAFSRNWAVGREGGLFYKDKLVGRAEGEPMLDDRYIWLAECLEETLNENR